MKDKPVRKTSMFPDEATYCELILAKNEIERLKKIASWASGKDFEVIESEYLKQKEEFPEFHI